MDLLEYVLMGVQLPSTPKHLTRALLKLFESGNEAAADALLDAAVGVVDESLTSGSDNSVFTESAYQNSFNNDLNALLKWEHLGKSEQATPRLRATGHAQEHYEQEHCRPAVATESHYDRHQSLKGVL